MLLRRQYDFSLEINRVQFSSLFLIVSFFSVFRLIFVFAGGFPLLLIQLYLVVTSQDLPWSWAVYSALTACAISTIWGLASFHRSGVSAGVQGSRSGSQCSCDECSSCSSGGSRDADTLLAWPGSLFRSVLF